MENIKWRRLLKALKNEGTVLFLGPNVERDTDGQPVFEKLGQKMVEEYEGEVSIDKDGFFFFVETEAKSDVVYDIKEFYEKQDFAEDIYKQLAAIPFHLIITLSPDEAIHNVFTSHGVKHSFAYFDSYKSEVEKPTIEKPLIYNLFGLATQGKYVLTQEDYFNYVKAVIGDDVLPKKIISALNSASNYLFIGFDFDKWYNRLLLMILNFHVQKEGKTRHAIQSEKTDSLYTKLVEKQFNITFVENNESDFIDTLYQKVKESEMLKPLVSREEALTQQIQEKTELLDQYEEKETLSDDPKEQMRCQKAIEELVNEIEELTKQLSVISEQ